MIHATDPTRNGNEPFRSLEQRIATLEEQLVQAQKLGSIGELSASITHEFNNILTTIINYAKLGLRNLDQEQRTKAFDKILSAGQRAAKITTGLLSYARSRGDCREVHELKTIVEDVLILVEKDLLVHRISLDYQCHGNPHAKVHPGQIQQVLLNLLVNARQAMRPGGRVTVRVVENAAEQSADISVGDTGCGIPADQLPRIFDQFYTTKQADEHGQGGTGLGLSLCRRIIESHGGRIRVESAVGHGTRFTLRFPLVPRADFVTAAGFHGTVPSSPADSQGDRTSR